MLSLTTDEATPAQARAKEKGKRIAISEESNTFELLILMQEIRDEMRGRMNSSRRS